MYKVVVFFLLKLRVVFGSLINSFLPDPLPYTLCSVIQSSKRTFKPIYISIRYLINDKMRYAQTILALALSLGHFISPSQAQYCDVDLYIGADQPGECTGEKLFSVGQNGVGTGDCTEAVNGACAIVTDLDEAFSGDCEINLYTDESCSAVFLAGTLDCNEVGDVEQVNYSYWRMTCF